MKKLLSPVALAFGILLLGHAASAGGHHPAVNSHSKRVVARPLVHYVVAVLQLPDERADIVRQALQAQPLSTHTPEQLAACLAPVLTPAEYDRLQQVASRADAYERLRFLAGQ